MLSLQQAGKRFGPRVLFLEADWLIRNDEKTALVGANGTGKSTLMKILCGLETLDYGTLEKTRGISIGYLPQEDSQLTGSCLEWYPHTVGGSCPGSNTRGDRRASRTLGNSVHARARVKIHLSRNLYSSLLRAPLGGLTAMPSRCAGVRAFLAVGIRSSTAKIGPADGGDVGAGIEQMCVAFADLLLPEPDPPLPRRPPRPPRLLNTRFGSGLSRL